MSKENVDLAYRVYDALNRRDLDGLMDLMDAEVEFMPILVDVEGGYRGYAGVRHWWESMFDTVPDFAAKVDGVRDLGALTLATLRPVGHGSTSGAPVEQRLSQVIYWRNAKAVRLESFRSEAEALKAVGLSEQAVSTNLDLVRSIYADWERGDYSHGEWAHPDIEYELVGGPAPESGKGVAAMTEGRREWFSAWEGVSTRVDEYRTLDAERVLVLFGFTAGRGKRSGLELADMTTECANVFHIRDGKVKRLVTYWDRDRALADLGLEDQAMPEEFTTPDLVGAIRAGVEAVNRRDWDAVERFYSPDAVDVGVEALGTFEGAAAIRGYYEDAASSVDDFHVETEEIIDLGNGVTFAVVLITGHPVGSSGEVRIRYGSVASWTGAVVERLTAFMDIDEGRAAAERLAEERG